MENLQNKMSLSEENLAGAVGGTFGDFSSLRQEIERYCEMLLVKTHKNPEDMKWAARIQECLKSAVENEPQCMAFLQQAGEAAKMLRDDKLKAAVLEKLDKWCDLIYL